MKSLPYQVCLLSLIGMQYCSILVLSVDCRSSRDLGNENFKDNSVELVSLSNLYVSVGLGCTVYTAYARLWAEWKYYWHDLVDAE